MSTAEAAEKEGNKEKAVEFYMFVRNLYEMNGQGF